MFRIEDIKNNDDYVVFFKIIEKKYINNFLKEGQIYFGLLDDYRKMEGQGQQSVGDSYEASLTQKVQIYIGFNDSDFEEIHGHKAGNNIIINAKQCAFCCYAVGLKRFDKVSETTYIHEIPASLLAEMCRDKGGVENCAIIIYDDGFIHQILDALKSKKLSYMSKKVMYDDYDYIPQFDIHSKEYSLDCCFHKRSKYKYQNEFRIATLNKVNEPIKDLYVNVEPNQIQVLELKNEYDFRCEVNINAHEMGRVCGVEFDVSCFLSKTE